MTLARDPAGWRLGGSTVLLDLEREVHQLHRLLRGSELRLELAPGFEGLLPRLASSGWIAVPAETAPQERSWRLVESRVIDGWLTKHQPAAMGEWDGLAACELQGGFLVVRRELADHPVFSALRSTLLGSSGSKVEKSPSGCAPAVRR
ncbi:hypothetical protein [Cyanobium sp. FACHB-13342]|uniref:hypothetical protein n=1 Tax=Cyanobium sp. FACHB-13342 TaxID=2692793 RepID=UPI0016800995|nr:hypothetical protein [Cyanobium sp. FACHB-13342]MBD2423667.1 hypothetical protein [Cyanobium sp. FACHB-13342]